MTSQRLLAELIRLSNEFGSDPKQVLAGGGNSSVKLGGRLWVKPSGRSMADMTAKDALEMDLPRVLALLDQPGLADDTEKRDEVMTRWLLEARVNPPDPALRPSVETALHALLPQRFVMHTHPEVANALCCAKGGERAFRQMRLPKSIAAVWIGFIDPGLPLALAVRDVVEEHKRRHGRPPNAVFMGKHGVICAADTTGEIRRMSRTIEKEVGRMVAARLPRHPFGPPKGRPVAENVRREAICRVAPVIRRLLHAPLQVVRAMESAATIEFVCARDGKRAALGGPLAPDQIVYCGTKPLWIGLVGDGRGCEAKTGAALKEFRKGSGGQDPKVVLIEGLCGFCVGPTPKESDTVGAVYENAVAIMRGAAAFGGASPLSREKADFIDKWRWENYRRKLAAAGAGRGRAAGKVAIVTGGGQGVGKGICLGLASDGAIVIVADMNVQAAAEVADEIVRLHGAGRAMACSVNVTHEGELKALVAEAVRRYGGLDLLVSNAGILKAFKSTDFPADAWRAILDVNLVGYFLCAKAAAPVMAAGGGGDIIQINSKSGKKGSKHNSAYAASKFGGIGLTQSLALDLIEDRIRVNCICPGNFFDLPLWSAPGGLFDQYRGKYGNCSREEVRKIYEAQIPMGRGCQVGDVVKTILYILEQGYETGQAYNVTGGQEMR